MAGNLKTLRQRWRRWLDTKAHPWERVKRWATGPKGHPRKVLGRWRTVQRWAKGKKEQAGTAVKKNLWRARYRVARRRAREKLEWIQKHDGPEAPGGPGMSTPSRRWNPQGRLILNWMIPWIDKIDAAGWNGVVVSGYRTPEYSRQLCLNMCGAPTCPGRCAGVNSNHNKSAEYPNGAVDVTDYWTFKSKAQQVGSPLRNGLPTTDPVHFSVSGV